MNTRLFPLHTVSPLRASTGQAADVIDLPTARIRVAAIPFWVGFSIKGVLRQARVPDGRGRGQVAYTV